METKTTENLVQMAHHQMSEDTPIELTIDSRGVAERTYGPKSRHLPEVTSLFNTLAERFPEAFRDPNFSNWEMVGLTKADGINYFEDTISVVFRNIPELDLIAKFTGTVESVNPKSRFLDYFTIKFMIESKQQVLKVYDENFSIYTLPALPPGINLYTVMGVGRHFGDRRLSNIRDFYFTHRKPEVMREWAEEFSLAYPNDAEVTQGKANTFYGYGITWDEATLKPIKLKRYFFPHDPDLLFADKK